MQFQKIRHFLKRKECYKILPLMPYHFEIHFRCMDGGVRKISEFDLCTSLYNHLYIRMQHILRISCLLTAMLLMAGCRRVSQMNLLTEAEAFLPAEPDSADVRLRMVDMKQLDGDEEESAYYALLRTMTDAMQGATLPNDTLVNRAYNYYRDKSRGGASSDQALVKHFAQSAMYMGDWYAAKDSIKASEDCYRQAIKYSKKAEDWHTCYISYSCLAEQIHSGNPVAAFSLIENAIKIYELCNDNIGNLISLYSYATHYLFQIAYMDDTTYQQALIFAYKAYNIARDSCFTDYYDSTNMLLAEIYWGMGEFQIALEYVKNIHPEDLESETSLTTNMKIAQFYLSCDSILKAKELYESPKVISDKTLTYLYARGMAEVAVHQHNQDSILFYVDSAFTASEAMFLDALQAKDEYYHDNLEKEKENERLIYKSKLKTWIFGSSIFIILIGGLLIGRVLILRIRVHRERRRNSIMQRKYELERNLEEKRRAESQMRLLQERQQALEESQQKKMATIKHLQRYIIDRTDVAMKLKDDTTHVKMSSKEWTDVEHLLDKIDDRRISKIRARFKTLSIDDIRLCVMVRLGMSNPAIGNVYGITPSAVQHRKLTLKKKGFGVENPDVTLDDFIESI